MAYLEIIDFYFSRVDDRACRLDPPDGIIENKVGRLNLNIGFYRIFSGLTSESGSNSPSSYESDLTIDLYDVDWVSMF